MEDHRSKLQQNSSILRITDFPHDVLALIHNKLYVVDQIRFRAVCKSWRIPEDVIINCFDHLMPWAFSYSWKVNKKYKSSSSAPHDHETLLNFECEIIDPRSKQKHTHSNSVSAAKFKSNMNYLRTCQPVVYATFRGWAFVGCQLGPMTMLFFIHNVFTNQLITLPHLLDRHCKPFAATFLSDHTEIFMLFGDYERRWRSVTFCNGSWSSSRVIHDQKYNAMSYFMDLQYIKGHDKVYLLYMDSTLRSYSLGAESFELVALGTNMEPYSNVINASWESWLVEKDGDLIMASKKWTKRTDPDECLVYKFDWSRKCWIIETNLKNTAIFTKTSSTSSFSTSLVEENDAQQQDCRIFFTCYEDGHFAMNCYSMTEKKLVKSNEYRWRVPFRWMNFIQLPYVKNN